MSVAIYKKEGDEYVRFGSLDESFTLKQVKKVPIYHAIGKYVSEKTAKKSKATKTNEKTYFSNLYEFLKSKDAYYLHDLQFDLTNEDEVNLLEVYKADLAKKVAPATVIRQYNTIKNFFNFCIKRGWITQNPCIDLEFDDVDDPVIHLWTKEDFEAVCGALDEQTRDILTFMWLTGARNCEAASLVWTDVIQDQGYMILRSKKNKGGKRKARIGNNLSTLLHKNKSARLHVFCDSRGTQYTSDSLGKKVKKAVLKVAQNKQLTTYGIRHTFCKDLLGAGFSKPKVQELMGHVDWRTTERYAHWGADDLTSAINTIR